MLSESDRHNLVGAGISFMQTVADIYGAEKGMELWSTIADTVDPDLKADVFMAMLKGNFRQDKITVKQAFQGSVSSKVELIRCLRNYDRRRLSLKEAKDIADKLESGQQVVLEVEPELRPTFKVELRKFNMVV
jgi:hypothetical protein